MRNEDLLFIEDANKRKLFYRFTPAAVVSNFVPLIVILHGEGKAETALHFEYKMWNVLTPLDNFGYENRGSCWLGEKGDFFLKDLLQDLIDQIAEEYECEDHIYLYGSGTGGYGAILHGILGKANAVYVYAPEIALKTSDVDTSKKLFYDFIFADTVSKEKDLCNFLNPRDSFPIFYLCEKDASAKGTNESTHFIEACSKHAVRVELEHCGKTGDEEERLKKVLDMFERVTPQV